jgi:hypothetical protein
MSYPTINGRTAGGFPLTIPEFKAWATRTGVEMLKVRNISYRKSRKGWQHEWLEVSLVPDSMFALRAPASADVVELPRRKEHLSYYDVAKNVQSGLQFRIDRGQRKATPSDPPSTRSVGHRFAMDMVELIDNTEELESDVLFTLGCPEMDGAPEYKFIQTRVFDIFFVLDRALETFRSDYALHSRNCWTFASFIVQSIMLLFHGYVGGPDLVVEGGLVRRLFPGSRLARDILDLKSQSNLFSTNALLGFRKDKDLP